MSEFSPVVNNSEPPLTCQAENRLLHAAEQSACPKNHIDLLDLGPAAKWATGSHLWRLQIRPARYSGSATRRVQAATPRGDVPEPLAG